MSAAIRYELHMGTLYFLELTHRLILTTRMEYREGDEKLIKLSVHPDYNASEKAGSGIFRVTVEYPEICKMLPQQFRMTVLNEDRYVYAMVPVNLGSLYAVFQIEAKATF